MSCAKLGRVMALLSVSLAALTGPAVLAQQASPQTFQNAEQARVIVDASSPEHLAVSVYRDPNRRSGQEMNKNWPRGFAMISETRKVTLPAGQSTIRFAGVAEGMVAVSAIVTGLPGGTIEKNRNADLLSPAALVNGMLGNRVSITRTNPGSGEAVSEDAVIRTRADGGLVLQTSAGYEAVRCSGIPERLTFDALPDGLSPSPVFTIDTKDDAGGTYNVVLTYLAWGFDWQANYVATLKEGGQGGDDVHMRLTSWLTILNDNGQSFAGVELMAIAGTLNVVSNFQQLATPPNAQPLRLTCYPLGSSLSGSPINRYLRAPPPALRSASMMAKESIVVTGSRIMSAELDDGGMMLASEEQLGDLKLYRVPMPVDVNAQGLKQVAFLNKEDVKGRYLYFADCLPDMGGAIHRAASINFVTVNDAKHGLGAALPTGSIAFFEPSSVGDLLTGEQTLRDYAEGQDVEIELGRSTELFQKCERGAQFALGDESGRWGEMKITLTNANPSPVSVRVHLGDPRQWAVKARNSKLKNGQHIVEVKVPGNSDKTITWRVRWIYES